MTPRVIHFERIDSTNAEAQRLAAAGLSDPAWIVADVQTAGRGRLGRNWISEAGNLYVTHVTRIAAGPARASELSFVAGLAVLETVAELRDTRQGLALKWPNDLLLEGRKCSGILIETLASGADWTMAAIGMGINLAHAPKDTPYPVTALGPQVSPSLALSVLQRRLGDWLSRWNNGANFDGIRTAWFAEAIGKHGQCTVRQGETVKEGVFSGLASDGALLLSGSGGEIKAIYAGDVSFAELDELRKSA